MPKAPEPSSTCQKTTKSLPRISPKSYCYNAVPNRFLAHFSTSRTNGPRLLSQVKADTLAFANRIAHSGLHGETGSVSGGGRYLHPRTVSHGSETLRGQVSDRQTLPLLRLDPVCSRRTQRAFGTAMRLCASLFRGAAVPLGCVILFLLSKLWLVCHALRVFPRVRDMGGITTLGVLCVLLKRRTAACQNGSFAVF